MQIPQSECYLLYPIDNKRHADMQCTPEGTCLHSHVHVHCTIQKMERGSHLLPDGPTMTSQEDSTTAGDEFIHLRTLAGTTRFCLNI